VLTVRRAQARPSAVSELKRRCATAPRSRVARMSTCSGTFTCAASGFVDLARVDIELVDGIRGGHVPQRTGHFEIRVTTARTFQLDEDLPSFELVDDVSESSVALGTSDLDLCRCCHADP
jgi:site-specific recombinase